ncbi:hypothetical protein PCANB_000308 [Pneumocystis canis]|nr:hypothetical protein PCK1_000339 [Pneumocystis canis]KAG5437962.1 hypothetical protein PCANB_000308 [Pneumocystis canis]
MYVHMENGQESFEAFKRKHLRQNREIIRLNMLQSVKVRHLEMETGRLLQENFELRASLISLQEQYEKEKKYSQFEKLGILKGILEKKLSEIINIVQNMLPEALFTQNIKNEEKVDNSIQFETGLNEKSKKKTFETKKIEKNDKGDFDSSLSNKQTNISFLTNSTFSNTANNDNHPHLDEFQDSKDSSFIYIEKSAFDLDKNMESKQIKEGKTLDYKKNTQTSEKNDTLDNFIYTKTKINIEGKKEAIPFLKTSQYEKQKDINFKKENLSNYEISCLKEKKKASDSSTEENIKTSEFATRKILESKPSLVNKKIESINEWKISQKIKTKNLTSLHDSQMTNSSSPERRVGRTKKPINYTLPSLKTKMRRDDTLIEEENLNKSNSKKKNISEDQTKHLSEEHHPKPLSKQEWNTNISFSSHIKPEKKPSVVIQKTTFSKCNPSISSMDNQKDLKSKTRPTPEFPIKFNNEKIAEDFDLLSDSDEKSDNDISCMNKKETNKNVKSESYEDRRRTVHDLSKIENSISFISEYKDIQNHNEILLRRKSMLA